MIKKLKKPKIVEEEEEEEEKKTRKELVNDLHKLLKNEISIKNKIKLIEGAVISSKNEAINELTNQLMKNKVEMESVSTKISLSK